MSKKARRRFLGNSRRSKVALSSPGTLWPPSSPVRGSQTSFISFFCGPRGVFGSLSLTSLPHSLPCIPDTVCTCIRVFARMRGAKCCHDHIPSTLIFNRGCLHFSAFSSLSVHKRLSAPVDGSQANNKVSDI